MFWRYMADRKLIDVKPTRREILYGFICTGISLVLLIIFGITIVVFANKYMQNMRGNQNYLENLSLITTTTTITTDDTLEEDENDISSTLVNAIIGGDSRILTTASATVTTTKAIDVTTSEEPMENWMEENTNSYMSEVEIKEMTEDEVKLYQMDDSMERNSIHGV